MTPDTEVASGAPSTLSGALKLVHSIVVRGFLFKGSRLLAILGAGAIVLMTIVNFVTVTGRHSPWSGGWLAGGLEISELLMALVTVLGGAYVWYLDAHVRIGLAREKAGTRKLAILDALAALLFLVWIGGSIWGLFIVAGHAEVTLAIRIPIRPFQVVFIAVLVHLSLVLVASLIQSIAKAFKAS